MPELRTARENARWKSGRSVAETHTRWAPWLYMTYGDLVMAALAELLVAGMRHLVPDPSGTPCVGRCQ